MEGNKDKQHQIQYKPPYLNLQETDDEGNEVMSCYAKTQNNCGDCCGFFRTWIPCVFCFCVKYPYLQVEQAQEGLFEKFGRYVKTVKAGLHYVNPCTEDLTLIDMRIKVIDLDEQLVLTRDNVSIRVDAAVYYRINNSRFQTYRVGNNVEIAVSQLTYALLKNTAGQFVLQDLLEKRNAIADDIETQVEKYVKDWGIIIENIYMKDIKLTPDLQEGLSSAARERRLAEAKLITARADVESAKLMREAADILDSRTAMQIRYLETISMVGKSGNTKIIFLPQEEDRNRLNHKITQGLLA